MTSALTPFALLQARLLRNSYYFSCFPTCSLWFLPSSCTLGLTLSLSCCIRITVFLTLLKGETLGPEPRLLILAVARSHDATTFSQGFIVW